MTGPELGKRKRLFQWLQDYKSAIESFGVVVLIFYTCAAFWQGCEAQRSANAASTAALAARTAAADSAEELNLGQRAWINLQDATMFVEPSTGGHLVVQFHALNVGKTPALHLSGRYQFVLTAMLRHPEPIWNSIRADPLGTAFPTAINSIVIDSADFGAGGAITKRMMRQYRSGLFVWNFWIRLDYDDIFGKSHWLTACYNHPYGKQANWFLFCGGSIDRAQSESKVEKR